MSPLTFACFRWGYCKILNLHYTANTSLPQTSGSLPCSWYSKACSLLLNRNRSFLSSQVENYLFSKPSRHAIQVDCIWLSTNTSWILTKFAGCSWCWRHSIGQPRSCRSHQPSQVSTLDKGPSSLQRSSPGTQSTSGEVQKLLLLHIAEDISQCTAIQTARAHMSTYLLSGS